MLHSTVESESSRVAVIPYPSRVASRSNFRLEAQSSEQNDIVGLRMGSLCIHENNITYFRSGYFTLRRVKILF